MNGPCTVLLTINALVAMLLTAHAWRRRPAPGASAFCVAMCAVAWWSGANALELGSGPVETQYFWGRISFLGIVALPVAWFSFACAHTARPTLLSWRTHLLLSVVPLLTTAIIWTNGSHHLFYASITQYSGGLVDSWVSIKGPWFWANMAYSYTLLLAGSLMVAGYALGLPSAHRAQSVAILIGVATPWVANVVHLTINALPGLDPTPFAFAVTGACLAWGLFRYRLLDVIPVAYQAVLEALPDAVLIMGADGRLVDANPATRRLLGAGQRELIGRSLEQLARSHPGLGVALAPDATTGDVRVSVGADTLDVQVETAPLVAPGGGSAGQVIILHDITDRKLAEQALREALDRFEAVIETVPGVAIQGYDRDGTVMHWNQASATIYGYEAHEAIGRRVQDLILPGAEASRFEDILDLVWRSAEAPSPSEWSPLARDGRPRWVYSSMFPVLQGGAVVEAFCMDVDVTDRRRLEETQRLAAVGQLAAGVAHEFNNLLAAIMMRAELTAIERTEKACEALTDLALRAARRGAETCRNLTAFARPGQPTTAAISLQAAIEVALALAAPQLQAAQVELRRDYADPEPPVMADPGQMEQIFLNLIINACHAMSGRSATEAPRVMQVGTRAATGDGGAPILEASVSDSGCGIRPEDLGRIFEPFFTTKGLGGTGDVSGSGLGLSVARSMVTAQGGTIEVSTELGVGTTFILRFTALDPDHPLAPRAPQQPAPASAPPGAPKSVLVAEDEDDLREVIAESLRHAGYTVTAVSSAAQATDALGRTPFDMVITDVLMPGGGRAVLTHVESMDPRPPVLVITGRADDALMAHVATLPGTHCLPKPFGITDVLRTVSDVLADPR